MKRKETMERMIRRLGVPAHLNGYEYIIEGVLMVYENPTLIKCVTKKLYPEIARQNNVTPSQVERSIRHAINVGMARADKEYLDKVFSYTYSEAKGKPTNAEYIACLSRELAIILNE